MKIKIEYVIREEEKIIEIGYMPKVDVKDGLVIEHSAETNSRLQPAMTHDLSAGQNKYLMPPIDAKDIIDVYLELPEHE